MPQIRPGAFAVCCGLLLVPALAAAWGNQGHDIIAVAAHGRLSAKARHEVEHILGTVSLAKASVFADGVRNERPETRPWHFVDIPIEADAYDPARDCKHDDCVIEAIARCAKALRDGGGERCANTERENLMFLIHFVSDLHQPLHSATKTKPDDDRGGNGTLVCLFGRCKNPDGKPKSLHRVWDTDMLVREEPSDADFVAQLAATIQGRSASELSQMASGKPVDWANEAHRLAVDDAYDNLPQHPDHGRFRLGTSYFTKDIPIVKMQLERAVVRLARVLEDLYGSP